MTNTKKSSLFPANVNLPPLSCFLLFAPLFKLQNGTLGSHLYFAFSASLYMPFPEEASETVEKQHSVTRQKISNLTSRIDVT